METISHLADIGFAWLHAQGFPTIALGLLVTFKVGTLLVKWARNGGGRSAFVADLRTLDKSLTEKSTAINATLSNDDPRIVSYNLGLAARKRLSDGVKAKNIGISLVKAACEHRDTLLDGKHPVAVADLTVVYQITAAITGNVEELPPQLEMEEKISGPMAALWRQNLQRQISLVPAKRRFSPATARRVLAFVTSEIESAADTADSRLGGGYRKAEALANQLGGVDNGSAGPLGGHLAGGLGRNNKPRS